MYEDTHPPIINNIPAPNSEIHTKDAKRGLKLKKSINFWGGRGSFEYPWIMKAAPNPSLNKNWAKKKRK